MTDFDEFFRASVSELVRFGRAVTGDVQRGEDAAQDALAKAYVHWNRVQSANDPIAYLKTAMINAEISWRRRLMSREVLRGERVANEAVVDDFAPEMADRDAVIQRLRRLPPRQRAALALRYFEDCSDADAARRLGCSESTVRSLVANGLNSLRTAGPTSPRRKVLSHDPAR